MVPPRRFKHVCVCVCVCVCVRLSVLVFVYLCISKCTLFSYSVKDAHMHHILLFPSFSTNNHYGCNSLFRKFLILKVRYSESSMFRNPKVR